MWRYLNPFSTDRIILSQCNFFFFVEYCLAILLDDTFKDVYLKLILKFRI